MLLELLTPDVRALLLEEAKKQLLGAADKPKRVSTKERLHSDAVATLTKQRALDKEKAKTLYQPEREQIMQLENQLAELERMLQE